MEKVKIPSVEVPDKFSIGSDLSGERFRSLMYPHRFDMGGLMFIKKGEAKLSINLFDFDIKCNDIITILPGSIIQLKQYSEDVKLNLILVAPDFIKNIILPQHVFSPFKFIQLNPVLNFEENDATLMFDFCSVFFQILKRLERTEKDSSTVLKNTFMSLFYTLIAAYEQKSGKSKTPALKRSDEIVGELRMLIFKYYRNERSLSFYAEKLSITPKYLSEVVRHATGKKVMDLIAGAVLLDAKAQLKSTTRTIQQISDSLNFPNSSLFGKYFKKHIVVSPKVYRESKQGYY
ncbi:MAG: helix-turn-helix domain-containing protein [Tannerellaceae bacterium]|nr:helix-turn-helix domain-containing protein [Tannerellaceae bacterium]